MIRTERREDVTVLTLEHGKVNAIDRELLQQLDAQLAEIDRSDVRAVVLTGSGSTFSAGVDLWRVLEEGTPYLESFVPVLSGTVSRLFGFPKPVVAALNGHAIAGGCVLACACDHRLMASGSGRIGVPELRVGVPFPSIALEIMRSAAPPPLFNRLVYRGELLDPEEAREAGLIEETVDPETLLDRGCRIANELAAIPAETYAITKRQYREPILRRAERRAREMDERVTRAWATAEVMDSIRDYMERTVRKGSS